MRRSGMYGTDRCATLVAMCLMAGLGGCGGGDDGGGTPPDPCSITNVNTGTQTSWLIGVDGPASLRWDHTGSAANVKIELIKAGTVVDLVAASTPNDGFFAWIPSTGGQPNGDDFGLRVTALGEAGCAGEKSGLSLTDVTGCALSWTMGDPGTLNAGGSISLTWSSTGTSGLLDIELWQDDLGGEALQIGIITVDTPDDGEFTWNPIDSFHFGTDDYFQFRLRDPLVPGCEVLSELFTMTDNDICSCVVTGFAAGSSHAVGTTMLLDLEQVSGSGFVDLRLLVGAELVPGGTIALDVPVAGDYDWVVTDFGFTGALRNRFRIRAVDSQDGYCVGQSDVFEIPQ